MIRLQPRSLAAEETLDLNVNTVTQWESEMVVPVLERPSTHCESCSVV